MKKISDYIYVKEASGQMKVPLKVFASKKLFEAMQQDKCLEQGENVAKLPGIKGASLMMPDSHQGYGFSVGGVAAFDAKKGIISPGGIGFDINCLPEGSKILTCEGYYKNIEKFEENFSEIHHDKYKLAMANNVEELVSYSEEQGFETKTPSFFMKRKIREELYEITTELGYKIKVTKEHPIMTNEGMIKAQKISYIHSLAINPFKGVEYEKPVNETIVFEEYFSGQQKKHLQERNLLPLKLNNTKIGILSRLIGYILGDGNIYFTATKGHTNFFGSKEDLQLIQKDILKLGFKSKIYSRKRKYSVPTKYGVSEFEGETYSLHNNSSALANLLVLMGCTSGNKTKSQITLPVWLMKAPKWIKSNFLSGFFSAEMSKPSTLSRTCFYCPVVSLNKNVFQEDSARYLLLQLTQILEDLGVKVNKISQFDDYKNKHGKTTTFRLILNSKSQNLLNLYEKIGFCYNKKRQRLSHKAIIYIKKKEAEIAKRKKIAFSIKNYKKKGFGIGEIKKLFDDKINSRFIERQFYEDSPVRLSQDFMSFDEFSKSSDLILDRVVSIKKVYYEGFVYDFNIPKNHNFVADNVLVSNCGVRLLTTNLTKEEIEPKIEELLDKLFDKVPPGMGKRSAINLTDQELDDILTQGPMWAVSRGIGKKQDVEKCESLGILKQADPSKVSDKAKKRGKRSIATLGGGNHFLEIQFVDEIFDEEKANAFGITKEGQAVVLIHTGSRGLGHQVCSDYLRKIEEEYKDIVEGLPEKNLAYAPADSNLAKDYFAAMCAAANFAWTNRHMIGHQTREAFKEVFSHAKLDTVYDVAHNIAKREIHEVNGEKVDVYVHRKGATRAFGPGNKEIPEEYRKVGQPVFIPGSMGTCSYVLAGSNKGMTETFGSTAHGAGRLLSRFKANKTWSGKQIQAELKKRGITVKAASSRGISEEAPGAYKDVEEVVKVSDEVGIATIVCRLKPIGVVKG